MNNEALANAFQLLASTVRDFHFKARPCLGATLKPVLSNSNLTEQILGFRKFGDFLRAAQAAGYVQLRPTIGGDISVWPASAEVQEPLLRSAGGLVRAPSPPPARPMPSSNLRVRQDLWNAFNSFSDKWVYDPTTDVAFKETNAAIAWNSTFQRSILLQIPTGRERVIEWMRSFATMQDPEITKQLLAALDGDTGPYRFNSEVRSRDLLRSWSHFHIRQVLAAVDAWASSCGVQPKNVSAPRYAPMRSLLPASVNAPAPNFPAASLSSPPAIPIPDTVASPLTTRLESLIDDLIDELLRLRGLLKVVGGKNS